MELPPFEHLLYYEKVHGARLNISYSNVREFRLDGFRRRLPKDLDLNWTFRNGTPELRRLIAKRHRTSPNRILVTTGATEANFLVNANLVRPRDRVLVDSPIYSPLRDVPRGVGANVLEIARDGDDGWRLDLDRWRKATGRRARLLVFANLNNPTSTVLSRADLRELADIAEECDGHVLRAKRILAVNRRIAVEALHEMPALRGDVPPAGTVMFLHSTVNVAKLASRLLKQTGTVIAEGRFFGVRDHFRLGLGGDTRDLRKGLANLRRLLPSMP